LIEAFDDDSIMVPSSAHVVVDAERGKGFLEFAFEL
jgi:hypothetical protein